MPIKVLFIEGSTCDSSSISGLLTESHEISAEKLDFQIKLVDNLHLGLELAKTNSYDVVLMDLQLPDSQGLDTLKRMEAVFSEVPVVVFTGLDDEELAVRAVEKGAQDYLTKRDLRSKLLVRSLRYAIERHRLQKELKRMTIQDDLTGLYNRRGFFTLGEQEFKLAKRAAREFSIVFTDLDGLKQINDSLGHEVGDQYIISAARFLKNMFRDSDIIARIGGDEFAIITYESSRLTAAGIKKRIAEELETYNEESNLECLLSMSVGIANFDPQSGESLDELLSTADTRMYQDKRAKQKA